MARNARKIVRIDPATRGPVVFALVATGIIVLVSFVLSYAALSTLAVWMSLPAYLGPLVPVFIDGAIIVYTYSALAAKAEGESVIRPWAWVGLWTTVSSGANAAHAWLNGTHDTQAIVGTALAALIPLGSLLGTHEIAARLIIRPGMHIEVLATTAERKTRAPRPVREPAPVTGPVARVTQLRPNGGREARDARILEMSDRGESTRAIAAATGASQSTVSRVIRDSGRVTQDGSAADSAGEPVAEPVGAGATR